MVDEEKGNGGRIKNMEAGQWAKNLGGRNLTEVTTQPYNLDYPLS